MSPRRREILALAAALIGCRRGPATRAIAERVVSTSASTTEALFAIGAGARVVGRSRYCDYPPEVLSVPSVGGYVDPSLEAILGLRPDLVVGARGPIGAGLVRTLEDRGIATWFPETESLEQIFVMIEGLGVRVGHREGAAAVTAAMRNRRAAIEAALAGAERPRVLLVFEKKPITVAGPGSFPDEMLRLAGATNALGEGDHYSTISLEKVLKLDPDVILDAEMGSAPTLFDSTWAPVRAVRDKHVVHVGDERVLRPGPRVLEGIATFARLLHPARTIP